MKTAKSIIELAQEIQRQALSKRDFIVPTQVTQVEINGHQQIAFNGNVFDLTDHALAQIADRLKIPKRFLNYLRAENPSLLEHNINDLFKKFPELRMIRTMDNKVRAFLSERYRPLDNDKLAQAVFPALQAADAKIVSCEITEKKMYIKAVIPHICELIPGASHMGDDHINPSIMISNSEIGLGGLTVLPGLHDPICTNLCFFTSDKYTKFHLGRKVQSVFAQLKDTIEASLGGEVFKQIVNRVRNARGQVIEEKQVQKVIEVTSKKFSLNEDEKGSVLAHLIERGDLSQWGISSAITRASEDVADYDRASELESLGSKIIEFPQNEWRQLVSAA